MKKIDVLNVAFDNVTKAEAVRFAMDCIQKHSAAYVVTPNPEIVMEATVNPALMDAVNSASLVLADGIGIIYGAKILGTPLKEKIPGIDFVTCLMEQMAQQKGSVYLFGAKPGVAEMAAKNLTKDYPGLVIAGCSDGYFEDDRGIIEEINRCKPDLLLVCLGFPKQEIWMQNNREKLDVGLMAGLGGSLDVFANLSVVAFVLLHKRFNNLVFCNVILKKKPNELTCFIQGNHSIKFLAELTCRNYEGLSSNIS